MTKQAEDRAARLLPNGQPLYVRVYDNEGETFDCYTVVFTGRYPKNNREFMYLGMSANPFDPQGFGQHGFSNRIPIDLGHTSRGNLKWPPEIGRKCHLGKRIAFSDLPPDCQQLVLSDYKDLWSLT